MTRDVSERYRWEVLPVGFCHMDADLRYIEINEWLAAVHGIPVADHLGRKISDAIPDVSEQTLVCLRRVIETGKPVTNRIVSGKTPGDPNCEKTYRQHYRAVRSSSNTIVGVSCGVEDISEFARAEAKMKIAHANLEQKVEARTAELNAALEQASLPTGPRPIFSPTPAMSFAPH